MERIDAAGAAGTWQATARRMERRWPERWSRADRNVPVVDTKVEVVVRYVDDAEETPEVIDVAPERPSGRR